jgi:2'-hydroxyisoflavone reductase
MAKKSLKILIIGGTGFLGRHVADWAMARGHELWLFNRGKTAPGLFPQATTVFGDRGTDLARLASGNLAGVTWDAVIDTNARQPRAMTALLGVLAGRARHVTFVSSISAYHDLSAPRVDETSPTAVLAPDQWDDTSLDTYGARKAACEGELAKHWQGSWLVVRPGLIVGPHDLTDRYTYWPVRLARGGDVVAPGKPTDRVRFVDVRDLADWIVRAVEASLTGHYNVVGPAPLYTVGEMIADVQAAVGRPGTHVHWVDAEFLASQGVSGWTDLPVWYPGFGDLVCDKAVATGLKWTPPQATARDTLAWFIGEGRALTAGLAPAREAALLAAWRARALRPGRDGPSR